MSKKGDKLDERIRPLTRGEIRQLRDLGFRLTALTRDDVEDAMDATLCFLFPEADVDRMSNPEAMELFHTVIDLTYPAPEEKEVKNSSTSGAGGAAADEKTRLS